MRVSTSAGARLRRLRWRLTALFTVTTAACLVTLGTVAVIVDTRSRERAFDSELDRRATGLSRAVWIDQNVLHLDPLDEDTLADGPAAVVVVELVTPEKLSLRYTGKTTRWVPRTSDIRTIAAQVVREEDAVVDTAHTTAGRPVRVAGSPVWGADRVQAVVVVAGDPGIDYRNGALLRWIIGGCLGLITVAAAAGHLLSGRSIRPAVELLGRQEQFLADAAHELRTPLTTLRLVAEAGARSVWREGPAGHATQVRVIRDVVRLSDQLGRLVAGLLARVRVQGGSQGVERLALRLDQLVEQVLDDLPPSDAELTVRTVPTVVRGDPDLLTQAVRNLVDNAITHGSVDGRPARVMVVVDRSRVAVQDHGPGIPASVRRTMFDWGVAGPGGGTGIGLAIVRWIAEQHNATITCHNLPDGGTVVEFVLPIVA